MRTFDAVIFTDTPTYPYWSRGYGAHRIASHLRDQGYDVLVVDFSIALSWENWNTICELAVGSNTRFVGFSTTWLPYRTPDQTKINLRVNLRDMMRLSDYTPNAQTDADTFTKAAATGQADAWIAVIKRINPKVKILLGGPKADWYTDFPYDHVISGYGETQILDFLEQKLRIWPTRIAHDTEAKSRDWGWVSSSTKYTEYDMIRSDEVLTLEAARGCRFKCLFCAFPGVGQKDVAAYIKGKDALYNELLTNYERWGATSYWLADDTVNDTTEKLRYMAEVIKQLPFKPRFRCYLRLDVLAQNLEQIELLRDIGMVSCFFGIESFHPEAAKIIGKGMSKEKRVAALFKAREVWGPDVSINAGYIIGLPQESYQFAREQMEWFVSDSSPVDVVYCFALMIHPPEIYPNRPCSELDKTYGDYGYSIPDMSRHENWVKDDGTDITSFARAVEASSEFNGWFDKKKKIVPEQIQYGVGNSITDPATEYFPQLITLLQQR